MLLALSVAGLVFLLVVVGASVAYLALPGGRFCPRCGGRTHPVLLRRWPRSLKRLLHWRWCAECGWEGLGRPPRARDPGRRFHWRRPDASRAPLFQWDEGKERDERPDEESRAEPIHRDPPPAPDPGPGFRWKQILRWLRKGEGP